MQFELITDVPECLLDFYQEEVRNEATGEFITEEYTYLDEDEKELKGTRTVAEYADKTYIVLNQRTQQVSWNKVRSIIAKHTGNKDNLVDTFINLAIATDHWSFHDKYITWMEDCIEVDAYNSSEQLDAEGEVIDFTPKEYTEKPQLEETNLDQWKLDNYSILRRAAYGSYESQLEMQFDGVWEEFIASVKDKYPKA